MFSRFRLGVGFWKVLFVTTCFVTIVVIVLTVLGIMPSELVLTVLSILLGLFGALLSLVGLSQAQSSDKILKELRELTLRFHTISVMKYEIRCIDLSSIPIPGIRTSIDFVPSQHDHMLVGRIIVSTPRCAKGYVRLKQVDGSTLEEEVSPGSTRDLRAVDYGLQQFVLRELSVEFENIEFCEAKSCAQIIVYSLTPLEILYQTQTKL